MLHLVEKIVHGVCALIVVSVGVLYVVFGTGSTVPIESLEKVKFEDMPAEPQASAASSAPRKSAASPPAVPRGPRIDENAISQKLRQQGFTVPAGRLQAKSAKVPSSTFEYVQHEANWMKELKQYTSMVITNPSRERTRLKLTGGVEQNTLLGKLGFQNGDVVELIDGQIVEFGEQSSLYHRSFAKEAIDKLRSGGSISVTVSRNRQPIHLVFSLR